MTIRQQGGIFGRNPTFNNVTVDGILTVDQIIEKTGAAGITLDGVTLKDGNVVLANGKGIDFSATAGTGTSELFDDYEEGTWTPTVVGSTSAGTATYGSQNGKYTKIGNQVFFEAYVSYSSGTGTGNLRISGLPFTHAGGSTYGAVSIGEINAITLSANNVASAEVSSGSTSIFFYQNVVGGGTVTAVPYDAAGFITFGGHYTTS
jgi:hypothetical protein